MDSIHAATVCCGEAQENMFVHVDTASHLGSVRDGGNWRRSMIRFATKARLRTDTSTADPSEYDCSRPLDEIHSECVGVAPVATS